MARLETTRPRAISGTSAAGLIADRRSATALALMAGVAAGLLSSWLTARGPTTTGNALLLMTIALALGAVAGALGRTRWILVPLFATYVAGVELGRVNVVGPTLDVRLDTVYGILAFALTRGLHGLLVIPSMALGVALGVRRVTDSVEPARRQGRPVGTALLGLIVAAIAVLVAWPASTPPILGPDRQPVPGSIAEVATVRLGGQDHAVLIRAADPDKPVLLYLSGGPGQSDLAFSRVFAEPWTRDFVVVDLDQRGNGRSYPAIDPVSSMTIDRAVADVVELTEYLRDRFDERRIYLMGESWGTFLGVLAAQERPDLFHAFIGSGQMVNALETDRRIYADLVAYAEGAGDPALLATVRAMGEPPYRDFPWANANLLTLYDYVYEEYVPSAGYLARGEAAGLDPFGALGSEYAFIDKANVLRGLIDTFAVLYPQLYEVDLRRDAPTLEVPVWILDGAAEAAGRRDLMLEYYDQLAAPAKDLITWEGAAHSVAFEQADAVLELLTGTIVPTTYDK